MTKILKLKRWLTLSEAAQRLSLELKEPVSEADVLYLVMDDRLKIYIDIENGATASPGRLIPAEEAPKVLGFSGSEVTLGTPVGENKVIVFDNKIVRLKGIYELAMMGSEALGIHNLYREATGGPEVELICLEGVLLRNDGTYFRLLDDFENNEFVGGSSANLFALQHSYNADDGVAEMPEDAKAAAEKLREEFLAKRRDKADPSNYYPAGSLPANAQLVFNATDLISFANSTMQTTGPAANNSAPRQDDDVAPKSETAFLHIIGALCELYWNAAQGDKEYSQSVVLNDLKKYEGFAGMSERNLKDKLTKAMKAIKS